MPQNSPAKRSEETASVLANGGLNPIRLHSPDFLKLPTLSHAESAAKEFSRTVENYWMLTEFLTVQSVRELMLSSHTIHDAPTDPIRTKAARLMVIHWKAYRYRKIAFEARDAAIKSFSELSQKSGLGIPHMDEMNATLFGRQA